jgi:hypothetical protein
MVTVAPGRAGASEGNEEPSPVGAMDSERREYTAPDIGHRSRFPEEAAAGAAGNGAHGPSSADAFKDAAARVGELKEYATYFVAAKLDGLKLTLRNVVLYAALGLVGAVVGATVLVTAGVYLLSGLAGAIGELFPEPYERWAGRLIVSLLVLGGVFGGVFFVMKRLTGSSRKRTIEKYENRKRDERALYGHDVTERAREYVAEQHRA